MDRRQQVYKNIARSRRIVVPASHRSASRTVSTRQAPKEQPKQSLLAAPKKQVVAQASVGELTPKPKSTTVKKTVPEKRITIESFSAVNETNKTSKSVTTPKKDVGQLNKKVVQPSLAKPQTPKQPAKQPTCTQAIQPQPNYPAQPVQYHNHYYGQPTPMQQQSYQAPVMQPSPYQQAMMVAGQQPQLPVPMARQQYPIAGPSGAAVLPTAPKVKKQSSVKPYSDSLKRGLAKIKKRMNRSDMKYKPSDILRYAIVTFFVIMASYLAFDTWNTNQKLQNAVGGDTASANNGQYDASADVENPPMQNGVAYPDYQVADDMPRILSIPSINITARISEVGLTNANKIDVPGDASFAGWYNGSIKPGEMGASFMTGHYNGVNAGGVFDNLISIETGAMIYVEMGDGTELKYEVVNIENVSTSQVDMSRTLSTSEGVVEGLNIMTCQGTWSASGFSHRLTVYTRRV